MTSYEIARIMAARQVQDNRQGIPCFIGSKPALDQGDLERADVAIIGVPFFSLQAGYENDVAPRKVRIAGLNYPGTYIPELDIDPADALDVVDYGDVDFPFGDMAAATAAVEAVVGEVLDAGCLPITIGGNAPAASFGVVNAIARRTQGKIGVISLDGHTDTEPDYGDEPNVSNWLRSAYLSIGGLSAPNHVQIGMRGMNNRREDMAFFRERGMRTIMAREANEMGSRRLADEAVRHAGSATEKVWLAIDLDVLDSSETPDWDFPDPYGIKAADILETAYAAGRSGKLCGISLMMLGGSAYSVQRLAVWIVLYGLAGVAQAG